MLTITDKAYTVQVEKLDPNGNALADAVFALYDSEDNAVKDAKGNAVTWTTGDTAENITAYTTAGNTYVLKETTAPDGYVAVADITFTVSNKGVVTLAEGTKNATVKDGVITVTDGALELKVSKTDMGGTVLEGATMELYESDGTTPVKDANGEAVTWESGEEPRDIGPYLTAGETYVLKETAAPTGYVVVTDITFKVGEDGTVEVTTATTTGDSYIDEDTGYLVVEDAAI